MKILTLNKATKPGTRTDLAGFKKSILDGKRDLELFEEHTSQFLRYFKGVQAIRMAAPGTIRVRPDLVVCIGRPGVGKTTFILNEIKDSIGDTHFQSDSQWWDGYTGQSNVVLDDFHGWIPLHTFLKLIDVVPIRLQIKGSFTPWFAAKKVYISSNFLPTDWWKDMAPEQLSAVTRRISKIILWDEDGEQQTFESWDAVKYEYPLDHYKEWLKGDVEPKMDLVV